MSTLIETTFGVIFFDSFVLIFVTDLITSINVGSDNPQCLIQWMVRLEIEALVCVIGLSVDKKLYRTIIVSYNTCVQKGH